MLKARKLPFVAIGQPEDDEILSVDHDQVGGCREMTSLLLLKGMKHIALLGGSMLYTVNQSRLEGFRQAYDKMGQVIDEGLLFWSWKQMISGCGLCSRQWSAVRIASCAWTSVWLSCR